MKFRLLVAMSCAVVVLAPVLGSPQEAGSNAGFLYGTVTTRSGNSHTGVLRWGTQEAFWDDLFHSAKDELPYAEYAKRSHDRDRSEERWWQAFGRDVQERLDGGPTRLFIARFGDIERIEVKGRSEAEITMKSGTTLRVSGYSDDVGATIHVHGASQGGLEVPWKKIATIVFKATSQDGSPPGFRLQGKVVTRSGAFDGFIQWDSQECLSTDKLDGDSEDGRLSLAMGGIRSIERQGSRAARVTLADGRELTLDGTNDVNDSIRGIMVEDARFGRVKIPWDEFVRVDFRDTQGSGRGYDDYPAGARLRATVTDERGREHLGHIVFDLDESESWEMVNGSSSNIEYSVPLSMVAAVEPQGRSAATVLLRTGAELRLEDGQDVTERNDGVVVLQVEGSGPKHIPWDEIRRIDFKWE